MPGIPATSAIQYLSAQPWVERLGWTLVHFLWQGAAIAALYAVARKCLSESPNVRYAVACAALAAIAATPVVTFSVIAASESAPVNTYVGHVPVSSDAAATVLPAASTAAYAVHAWRDDAMPWLVMAWFAGAIVFWVRLMGGWIVAARMRSMLARPAPSEWQRTLDRLGARIRVSRPVRLFVSALVHVPTVVGWLRPVVLVPVGALAGLPNEYVEALLAHELAHIRRQDYFVNILQSVAEALLFYHPAVWWISSHIRSERELCCDDAAVAISGDAFIYARALSDLERFRPVHFTPMLAANGGSLPERIARLLGVNRPATRRASGPAILAVAALIVFTAAATLAQPPSSTPSFEVASIKPTPEGYIGFQSYWKGDRYTAMTATLKDLIGVAFHLRSFQISGGPAWSSSAQYNVSAKMDAAARPEQVRLMIQNLLADRFSLKFHRVTKNFPGYALTVDKNGPKLTESKNSGPGLSHGRGSMFGRGADMGTLVAALSENLDSPIANRTGLKALYDFTLAWTPDDESAESPGPSLFTAIREQLGLRLEAVKKVPVEILVIDHAEKPSEN